MDHKYPGNKLTVVIRDASPVVFFNDLPRYRSVTIELTPEQIEKLKLEELWKDGAGKHYEEIAQCFFEIKIDIEKVGN